MGEEQQRRGAATGTGVDPSPDGRRCRGGGRGGARGGGAGADGRGRAAHTARRRATATSDVERAPAATTTAATGGNRSGRPNVLVVVTHDQLRETEWADHGWLRESMPCRPSLGVPFYPSWPGGGLGAARTDDRLTAHVDIAPTLLDAADITPDTPRAGHSLLGTRDRDHLLAEWWWNRRDKQPIHSWATYIGKTEQYTEYYGLRLDRQGRLPGGVKLHGASAEQERRFGVPESARRLTAARAT
ncbi:hypothetical protein [Streptomyces mirabilis]|uniref:hypothetical protein n=1 Tax=Streptomyces mirabilis TaxID=68239 RepID=UPI00331AA4EF